MKSRLQAVLVIALLIAAMHLVVGCSQQEPPAPAADEPEAETATQEPPAEFSDGFETGDTDEWSEESAADVAPESAAIEDPASEPEASDE